LLCDFLPIGGHLRPRRILFFLFFVTLLAAPNEGKMPPTHVPSQSHAFSNVSSAVGTDFWLVVASPYPAEAIEIQAPPLSLFSIFLTLNSPPKTTSKRPPHTFLPSRVSSPIPPLPPTPSFC
jgi:hypothetical protein